MYLLVLMSFLVPFSFLPILLYCKNMVYNTFNMQNMCQQTVYVIGKAMTVGYQQLSFEGVKSYTLHRQSAPQKSPMYIFETHLKFFEKGGEKLNKTCFTFLVPSTFCLMPFSYKSVRYMKNYKSKGTIKKASEKNLQGRSGD